MAAVGGYMVVKFKPAPGDAPKSPPPAEQKVD